MKSQITIWIDATDCFNTTNKKRIGERCINLILIIMCNKKWLNRTEHISLLAFWAYLFIVPLREIMGDIHSPVRSTLLILMAIYPLLHAWAGEFKTSSMDRAITAFFLAMTLSTIFSTEISYSLHCYTKTLVPLIILYFSGSRLITTHNRVRITAAVIVVSSTIVIVSGFLLTDQVTNFSGFRFEGLFDTPTQLGKYLDLIIPVTIVCFLSEPRWIRFIIFPTIILQAYALLNTGTRGSIIGVTIALSFLIALMRRRLLTTIIFVLVILGASLSFIITHNNFSQRIVNDSSMKERYEIYKASWLLIKERPFLGWGYGDSIEKRILKKRGYNWLNEKNIYPPVIHHAHNLFLQLLIEGGIVAALAGLWIGIMVGKTGFHLIFVDKDLLTAGFFLGLLALAIHTLISVPQWINTNIAMAYIAVITGVSHYRKRSEPVQSVKKK